MPAAPASPMPHFRWLTPVLIVVVCLMVGGGLLARELYRQPQTQPDSVLAVPSNTTTPPGDEPGSGRVELTPDAAAHPQHDAVQTLIQTYFDSINNRDYASWKTVVSKARIQAKPTLTSWLSAFDTTKDGSILIYRIDSLSGSELRVYLGFTSTQDPSQAPPELPGASCVRWNLILPLIAAEPGIWKVDNVEGPAVPDAARC